MDPSCYPPCSHTAVTPGRNGLERLQKAEGAAAAVLTLRSVPGTNTRRLPFRWQRFGGAALPGGVGAAEPLPLTVFQLCAGLHGRYGTPADFLVAGRCRRRDVNHATAHPVPSCMAAPT